MKPSETSPEYRGTTKNQPCEITFARDEETHMVTGVASGTMLHGGNAPGGYKRYTFSVEFAVPEREYE